MGTTAHDSIDRFAPPPEDSGLDTVAREELGRQYRIARVLAERADAVTYFAHEVGRRRPVVLRVRDRIGLELEGSLDVLEATLSEIAALEHPNIVPVYRFGVESRTAWWTTQFVRAPSLADLVRSESPLPLERVIAIAAQVATALAHAHDHGIAHGQVSPDTVLVREADWAVLDDFAVVRAPAARSATPAGDQQALALTIFRCLTAELDRSAASIATSLASPVAMVGRRPDLAPSVAVALARGMDSDPTRQFGSVLDLVAALRPTQSRHVAQSIMLPDEAFAEEITTPPPRPRKQVTRRQLIATAALVGSMLGGLGLVLWHPWASEGGTWSTFAVGLMDSVAAESTSGLPAVSATFLAPPPPAPPPAVVAVTPPPPTTAEAAPPKPVPVKRAPAKPVVAKPVVAKPSAAKRSASTAAPKRVQAGRVALPPVAPAAPGRLFVSSRPWGQLYLDDRLVGPTPKAAMSLPAGQHLVRISRPGFRSIVRQITVAPGADVRLIDLVLEAGQ